ncbi:dynein light chain LC6 [Forsythia ovata]|uniref:Dynein light chain LC6 n=1 Tax=Forsythia ovata TaxID=205694 RepID=A0ABD1X0U3_9LAMI
MLEGKAIVRETDMPDAIKIHVMELAYQALDLHEVSDCQSIAHYIKQPPAWHRVVGWERLRILHHTFLWKLHFFTGGDDGISCIKMEDASENKEEAIRVPQKAA